MKKTLLFVGVFGVLLSANAFADDDEPVRFGTDAQSYPAFTDTNSTHIYATKHTGANGSGDIKVTAATTKFVNSRAGEANTLVTNLSTRATTDQGVVNTNQTDLQGTAGATAWASTGLENNRQVKAGSTECQNLDTYRYSGCGYINDGTHTDGQTGSHYKWVKIATNCDVAGQETESNCVGMTGTGTHS